MSEYSTHLLSLFSNAYRGRDRSREGDTTIHVSNLINFCPRTYYLCHKHDRGYHGYRSPSMGEGWTFDMGHAIQQIQVRRLMMQKALFGTWECRHCKHSEVGLQEEKACPRCRCKAWKFKDLAVELRIPVATTPKSQLIVRGHIDYVVALSPTEGFVVDAKSIKAENFDLLKDSASVDYERQVQLYMWIPNTKGGRILGVPRNPDQLKSFKIDPNHAVVAYSCKGARQMPFKPIGVEQNPKFIRETYRKLKALADCLAKDEPPEKICNSPAAMMAKACVARDLCFEQGFGQKR